MKLFLLAFCFVVLVEGNDNFYEHLKLEQVNRDQVYGFFNFTTTWNYENQFIPQHYRLFPRSIGQLISKYNIAEFHFLMTQGLWRYKQWGFPYAPSSTGAELWVWFHKNTKDVERNWVGFTNALSGLFCASLNFMNKGITATPLLSFRPAGLVENGTVDTQFLRHAVLARETPCTENLTPWMKLLPCGSMSGPASLLNPSRLQHSRFLSMGLHLKHDCSSKSSVCHDPFVQLQQHVSVVYDIRSLRTLHQRFGLMSLFGKKLKPACPVATKSDVFIKTLPELKISNNFTKIDNYHHLNLFSVEKVTNIVFKWTADPHESLTYSSQIFNHCYVTGLGLNGGLKCSISNHMQQKITVIFFQVIPWFLNVQLHTLTVEDDSSGNLQPILVSFSPAAIRQTPYRLEVVLELPSSSVVNLHIQFTRGFLTWTEHPPDANHGFYINPAVVTIQTVDLKLPYYYHEPVYRFYSEALLVNIPVPDFSMPYNVICLVCTVIAISFGTFYNLIAKRLQLVSSNVPHPVRGFLNKILSIWPRKN